MLMIQRRFWQHILDQAWQERSVIWLSGVRRVGKTCLCQSLPHIEYFDCELPRVRRMMEEPEGFFDGLRNQSIVLDEIHRLQNPSELLKIAADHYPRLRVIATGSSTLGASRKFRDTLAGRKRDIWLAPMCLADLKDAERPDLHHRLYAGDCRRSFWLINSPSVIFRSGWTPTGPRTSKNCSGWRAAVRSRSSSSWCWPRAAGSLKLPAFRVPVQ